MEQLSHDDKAIVQTYLTNLFAKFTSLPPCPKDPSSNLILDFTQVFKKKVPKQPMNKSNGNKENLTISVSTTDLPTPAVSYEIPRNLTITQSELKLRKCLDVRRWLCMARPQYSKSCGITSLVSCWNYLYSTLGTGTLPPISQEEAMVMLGFAPPFGEIKFGPFTGNGTLIKWFGLLNRHFNVKGEAGYFWKMHGGARTVDVDADKALGMLKEELIGETSAFIYHCYNHYCCPIGFEVTPTKPHNAYKTKEEIAGSESDHWIIIGEPSKCYPVFHVKKWTEIAMDISNQYPEYYNIRKPEKGIMKFKGESYVSGKNLGKNPHCLLIFRKLQ